MVEWGMTPIEAIQASTINTAELFGLNNIGEIKESFDADIVAVKGIHLMILLYWKISIL